MSEEIDKKRSRKAFLFGLYSGVALFLGFTVTLSISFNIDLYPVFFYSCLVVAFLTPIVGLAIVKMYVGKPGEPEPVEEFFEEPEEETTSSEEEESESLEDFVPSLEEE